MKPIPVIARHRSMRLLALPLVLVLASCGASSGAVRDATSDRLLAAADSAAHRNGGEAKHVEAVETTRGKAADLTGHSNQNQDEDVWVVQVSGDHYRCDVCSHPAGAQAPRGDVITIVLRASDFQATDGGLGPRTELSAFGEVRVLRG